MSAPDTTSEARKPSLLLSLLPVLFLIAALSFNVFIFGDAALDGSNQMVLLLSAAVAALVGFSLQNKWSDMLEGVTKSIGTAIPSIVILLLVGSLIGTWILSGIVPALIYYGLQVLSPSIFLFASCIICAIVSIATGSSWTTAGTVGVALIGIGQQLGIDVPITAGAIISGSYFGDKVSPLSDTTNLAAAMGGVDLFRHIRYMLYTTVPSFVIAALLFLGIGLFSTPDGAAESNVAGTLSALENTFNINGWLFIAPAIVIAMIIRKVQAIPALLIGALLGGLFTLIFQPQLIAASGGEQPFWRSAYTVIMRALYEGVTIESGNANVDDLLSKGGMSSMLGTVWLIVCAMIFGGVMEACGFLQRITAAIISVVRSAGSLIASTAGTCMFFNLTASDQYLAIVVPGRMFADSYKKQGLAPENMTRTLEDAGTVTSVLIPWNTCGAYHVGVLGIASGAYIPYCFFNLLSPFMTMLYGFIGIKLRKLAKKEPEVQNAEE